MQVTGGFLLRGWRVVGLVALAITAAPPLAGAAIVTVPYKGPRQLEEFEARGIEILAFTKHGVDLLAEGPALDFLMTRPYPVSVSEIDPFAPPPMVIDANLGLYHTYAETESVLAYLGATYPAIADTVHIGTSLQNRNLTALKVSDHVSVDENEPEILYMGDHHARELMSVEIPLRFAKYLLEHYGVDANITHYIDTREIFFIPMVNPDGHVYVQQNHAGHWSGWWRKNRRNNGNGTFGVDLNRNYGYQWGYDNIGSSPSTSSDTYRGTGAFSEPETQRIRDFVNTRDFTTWLSYHSYGELLLYGWGYAFAFTPDHEVFAALADTLARENGYLTGNPATGAIYRTNGDSDDWGYGEMASKAKIFAFTPEVNSQAQGGFGPPESVIQTTFDLLLPMNLKLLEWGDNPYRVVAPHAPSQYALQAPYANAIARVSWTGNDPGDPNPVVSYDVEGCLNPYRFVDACTASLKGWVSNGFFYTASGLSGGGYDAGNGNGIAHTLTMDRPFVVEAATDSLRFSVNFLTEENYDYGYVEVSTNGVIWATIPGNITTSANPYGNNRGHGFTGSSNGWVNAIFPLTAYAGQEIMLRFAYVTDQATVGIGIRIDNIDFSFACGSVSILASGVTDTLYDHVPATTGTWRYRVRARDAENHASRWSNPRDGVVATLTAADAPRAFRTDLGPNYPNPFNPATQIPFVVGGAVNGKPSRVELAVFSVTGARVVTLVNEARPPGTYVYRWDGRDSRGVPSPTGIYFARLTVDGATSRVRKLLLLK
jgi:Zinc carboxypeptidase/Immune inhibitor A-like, MAM domain